jgi:hypothetical protein
LILTCATGQQPYIVLGGSQLQRTFRFFSINPAKPSLSPSSQTSLTQLNSFFFFFCNLVAIFCSFRYSSKLFLSFSFPPLGCFASLSQYSFWR